MKFSSRTIGLFQAACLTIYVSFFAITVQQFQQWLKAQGIQAQPVLGIIIFLLAFIISAVISVSIVFSYPIFLFFENKKEEAVKVIFWSLAWLIIFFAAFLIFGFIFLVNPVTPHLK